MLVLKDNKEWLSYLARYKVPPSGPPYTSDATYVQFMGKLEDYDDLNRPMKTQEIARQHYHMWALVDLMWTGELVQAIEEEIGKSREDIYALEIMAGVGWLAQAIRYHGMNIHTSDWAEYPLQDLVYPHGVLNLSAFGAVVDYRAYTDVLICSWPPTQRDDIVEAAGSWPRDKPIVYIGEHGGCGAPDKFFEHFDATKEIWIPRWKGIHDECWIGYWRD